MTLRVLVAGATGAVGGALLPMLRERGHWVRTLSRRPIEAHTLSGLSHDIVAADATRMSTLDGVAEGIDVVVSCLGASVALGLRERRSYWDVDRVANENLLELAKRAGVKRFVYVSVFIQPSYAKTRYVRAHEAFVKTLRASGVSYTIVRPTGIFTALDEFLKMAQRGRAMVIGDGRAHTNPVDPRDVAAACLRNLEEGPEDVEIGGPQVLTRKAIAETAFAVVGKKPAISEAPPWAMLGMSWLLRPLHPRLSDLMDFAVRVSTTDVIAPARGARTLRDYFQELYGGPVLAMPTVAASPTNGKGREHSL